jgi:serine/threonine-protein kinase
MAKSAVKLSLTLSAAMFAAAAATYALKRMHAEPELAVETPAKTTTVPISIISTPTRVPDPHPDPEPDPEPDPAPDRTPRSGTLTIDTKPWSEVYLAGKQLGITPMVGVKLPAGTHQLELKNPSLGITKRIRVTIRPGKATRVQRDL